MRIHALESTGGLANAEMGQYVSAADPSDPAGTNDPAAAQKDADGNPVSNGARNIWVTETALSTALYTSFLAEGTALFGIVVGIALILRGSASSSSRSEARCGEAAPPRASGRRRGGRRTPRARRRR